MKSDSAIVLNGSYHNALTIVRSLARRGIRVHIGDEDRGVKSRFGEAMLSRYACSRFLYPSPVRTPREFMEKINDVSSTISADVLLPVGANTCITVSTHRELLAPHIKMALADDGVIQKAHDKYECLKFAESIGIPIPKTILLRRYFDGNEQLNLGEPLVLKPRRGGANRGVRIIRNSEELSGLRTRYARQDEKDKPHNTRMNNSSVFDDSDPLVQEYVDGIIVDACAIADRGKVKAVLSQVRLKTLPPTGGYGVMNETRKIPVVIDMARRLLEGLGWHGVAQVEFKLDTRSGEYRLMEVNPKFWGTLALSVEAGMDFPYLCYRLASGTELAPADRFEEGCVYRWVIPNEFQHVIQSADPVRALRQYLSDFLRPAHYNMDLKDPLPILSLVLKLLSRQMDAAR